MDSIAIIAACMFVVVYLYVVSSVKVGQIWESCNNNAPFKEQHCEYRKVIAVESGWVQYKLWHTGWPRALSQKGQSRIYSFIFMKLKQDVRD